MRTTKSDLSSLIRLVQSGDSNEYGCKTLFGVSVMDLLLDLRDSLTMEKLHANPALHNVVNNLVDERFRQDEKWGGAGHDDKHTVAKFVQWIEDYAGWARMMDSMRSPEKARRRLVQVAALAVAAVERIDRERESGPGEEDGPWAEGWIDRTYEALGWMHAECCAALDRGEDPRGLEVPELAERCRRDLERDGHHAEADLGQFGHHANPAIDFCHEVECLQGMVTDARLGLVEWSSLHPRLGRALTFRVGGDEGAVRAMEELRALAETVHVHTTTAPDLRRVEEVATIESTDPLDERRGFYLSTESRRILESLPPGTKLYVDVGE